MKKALLIVVLLGILASLAAIPLLASASGSGVASDCVQPTPRPTPRGMVQDNPADGGKIWVDQSRNQAGAIGPNGFIVIDGNKPQIYGYNPAAPLSGRLDPTGTHPLCLSVAGNKVQPL